MYNRGVYGDGVRGFERHPGTICKVSRFVMDFHSYFSKRDFPNNFTPKAYVTKVDSVGKIVYCSPRSVRYMYTHSAWRD